MRFGHAVVVTSIASFLVPAAPTLARNSKEPKAIEQPVSSSCHAYQQAADGTWRQLPCQEMGPGVQTQHKPAPRTTDDEER